MPNACYPWSIGLNAAEASLCPEERPEPRPLLSLPQPAACQHTRSAPSPTGADDEATRGAERPRPLDSVPEETLDRSSLTPVRFLNHYRHLPVRYYPSGTDSMRLLRADVHLYINENLRASGRGSNLAFLEEILRFMRRERRESSGRLPFRFDWSHRLALRPVFNGVGSPSQVSLVLQYALALGQTDPGRLPSYCDTDPRVGVDCVGFVSNYLLALGLYDRLPGIRHFPTRRQRYSFDDPDPDRRIRPNDVLYWRRPNGADPPFRHIAIIDSVHPAHSEITVAESSGSFEGLHAGRYRIRMTRDHLFPIDRGVECHGSRNCHVTIHAPR